MGEFIMAASKVAVPDATITTFDIFIKSYV